MDAARALLEWYRTHRRDLPWRRTRDPWAVWVSEVMLQQTRVEHVIPYYERFLARFPTPAALAAAPLDEALAAWSGLGYYRRLRLLHRAAGVVAAAGGELPRDAAGLRLLPGVGEYTAAAVASIAFGEAVPVLDGNVERVVCRWLGVEEDPRKAAVRRRLRAAAAGLLVPQAAGDCNQALMELGATVCTPRRPACPRCPLAAGCRARACGRAEALPVSPPRREPRRVALAAVVVADAGRLLLFRRDEEEGLLGGTWELPWAPAGDAAAVAAALRERYGIAVALGEARGVVRHAITVRRLEVTVLPGSLAGEQVGEPPAAAGEARWVAPGELAGLPLSSLVGKVLARAAAGTPAVRDPGRRRTG